MMGTPGIQVGDVVVIERAHLERLFDALRQRGYQIVGPTVRDEAIIYDLLTSAEDLPIGWTDEQDGGYYRLKRRNDEAVFGYAVGPHSWKKFVHPPALRLWRAERENGRFRVIEETEMGPPFAFIGVRSCELHALAIQDKIFLEGAFVDPVYKARRSGAFIVAVNCGQAGGTCFCASMNAGPRVTFGFDLALTELLDAERHEFIVEVGTERGAELLGDVPCRAANDAERAAVDELVAKTAAHMGRTMETGDIKELLYRHYEHPRWDDVARRCLTCGNCTMVCPTCFCTTVEEVTDLQGQRAERWRKWDSCFTLDFTYLAGGRVRASAKARYRQWMTHKLATWIDQFGTSGCVGCGRCITWCPVAIDITEEVRAIRESERTESAPSPGKEQ